MRAHDRAAARSVPRFNLTVTRIYVGQWGSGCNVREFEGLTERELNEEKQFQQECWPEPAYELTFEAERV